jgi:hypothetical protein
LPPQVIIVRIGKDHFFTKTTSQIKRFVYSTNTMFIYNSSVLDFLACTRGTVFFTVSPCLTQFFFTGRPRLTQTGLPSPRGGLTSHRQTSHREAYPHTEQPSLAQRGPTSGPPSPHAGKPHADMLSLTGKPHLTQANFTQAFLVSHVCSKKKSKQMSSDKKIQSFWVFKPA